LAEPTCTGERIRVALDPIPIRPLPFDPHAHKVPSALIARVWYPPGFTTGVAAEDEVVSSERKREIRQVSRKALFAMLINLHEVQY
jgi:hypothetical protein